MENSGSTNFVHDEIISQSTIQRGWDLPFSSGQNYLQIPEQMPHRKVGVYLEAVLTGGYPAYNYYIAGHLSFIRDGQRLAELPIFVGQDGLVDPNGVPITAVCKKTLANLFFTEPSQVRWSLLLSSRFSQSRAPIVPMGIITPATRITWSIDDYAGTPNTVTGYRVWIGCLSSTDPIT